MPKQKPDVPAILNRLIEECRLPKNEEQNEYKLNRHQLLELLFYVEELKKTNISMYIKIQEMEEGKK